MSTESASKTDLFLACQFWARDDVVLPLEKPGYSARIGSAVHAAIELALLAPAGADTVTGADTLWQLATRTLNLPPAANTTGRTMFEAWCNQCWSFRGIPEVSFAYDPRTESVRLVGIGLTREQRNELVQPHEFAGTADAVSLDGDTVRITDWKTGFLYPGHPRFSGQLLALAFMACRVLGKRRAIVEFVRVRPDGCSFEQATIDGFELDAGEALIAAALIAKPNAEPTPGEHCVRYYCPLRDQCIARKQGN